MRPRFELLAAVMVLVALGVGAMALGSRGAPATDSDRRLSAFVAAPSGARALADAFSRMGITVERFRRRTALLDELAGDDRPLLLVLDPSTTLDPLEGSELAEFANLSGDLLLAGPGARAAMLCFGYDLEGGSTAPLSTIGEPGGAPWDDGPRTRWALRASGRRVEVDSSAVADQSVIRCRVAVPRRLDTLLVNADGNAVMLQLELANSTVYLAADRSLFTNRSLRDTEAGPFLLAQLAGRYPRVVFDEYHHGFRSGGSMTGLVLGWLVRSPTGWAIWQLMAVSTLALLLAAVRFGPARAQEGHARRSPLEHVRALAAALSAARGHDVAVRLMIEGLRRRLSPRGQAPRSDVAPWLDRLAENVRTPESRAAVKNLQQLIHGPVRPDGVLRAANAVEDVWQDLKP